ncbi:CZB domain-containing protein [Sapientia aquatica]|uniref:Chemotaxis protein n=1 Tax=Sapientia aquatica TaxID=1549640 RepID=A0A4R5W819_9BURK|nr:CZB domain-containing protein [Sapientia aquatica]TDK68435.1 chemotaxis protein [Sapientia aquatica]
MDLRSVYEKDKELKDKFIAAIESKWQLDDSIIAKSDRCELGAWLSGEAERKYKFLKSYKPCIEAHDAFHVQASKVARQINLGEYESAKAMIADGTPFYKSLAQLGVALIALKKDAKL